MAGSRCNERGLGMFRKMRFLRERAIFQHRGWLWMAGVRRRTNSQPVDEYSVITGTGLLWNLRLQAALFEHPVKLS